MPQVSRLQFVFPDSPYSPSARGVKIPGTAAEHWAADQTSEEVPAGLKNNLFTLGPAMSDPFHLGR